MEFKPWKPVKEPEEVRTAIRSLNSVSVTTSKMETERILNINILEDHENLTSKSTDEARMTPFVKVFIDKLLEDTVFGEIYSNIAAEITYKWKGRQGQVFIRLLLKKLQLYIETYFNTTSEQDLGWKLIDISGDTEAEKQKCVEARNNQITNHETVRKNRIVNIIVFLVKISKDKIVSDSNIKGIPIEIGLKALHMFYNKTSDSSMYIFLTALSRIYLDVKDNKTYIRLFSKLYSEYLNKIANSEVTLNKSEVFKAVDVLNFIKTGHQTASEINNSTAVNISGIIA